ncbi:MAG TPA: glycosyltransferase family 87 protein [Lacipirellula sp.]
MPATAPAAPLSPSVASASASAGWRLIAWALVFVGVARLLAYTGTAPYRNDFAHYYLSANILLSGENPYMTPLEPLCRELGLEYDRRIPTGANPPLLIRTVTLVAWLPLPAAYWAWVGLQTLALGGLLMATRRLIAIDADDARWLLIVGVVLNTTTLQRQIYYSQVQVMVAAALAAALLLHVNMRFAAAAALATLAAALKLYPAALVPWFMLAGLQGWRDFARRSLSAAAVGVAVLGVTGIETWRSFIVDGLPVIKLSVGTSLTNYSLPNLVNIISGELFGWPLSATAANLTKLCGKLLAVAALAGAYIVVWRRRLEPIAALGILTAAMMTASLVCWSHYFVLMTLPVAWLWRRASETGATRGQWPLLIAGSLCLWPELDWAIPITGDLPRLLLHFYPLAALAAVGALLASSRLPCKQA